jgi:P-type conjugative transfer ATPase TrbB
MSLAEAEMPPSASLRMLQLVANTMEVELSAQRPSLAAILPGWGARLQAMVPPVSPAPVFTLRKPPTRIFTLANYVEKAIISEHQADAIRQAVQSRANILVGGSTGAGKTTLVNAILDEVAQATKDRVYIVEDIPELQCRAQNKIQLLVQSNYSWQNAIRDAMRSRPDRIIVGEVREGAAALDLVKAWNTGHPGGLGTVHANDTASMLSRIFQLIEEVANPSRSIIADTINVCVHLQRDPSHPAGRRLSGIDRVRGLRTDGGWYLDPIL